MKLKIILEKGKITPGHGRALLALDAPNKIKLLFRKIVEEGLNVRQAEAWSRKLSELEESRPKKSKGSAESKIFLDDLERNLGRALSAKVKLIESSKNRGRIEIYFNNLQELERIIELVQRKR